MFHRLLWQSPQSLPLALAAAAVAGFVLLWLYQSQLRMLPVPWTWLLPALRLAAVAVMLGALLKPAVLRMRSPWEQGAVVLLVDQSRSMSVIDRHRGPAQRIAIADALGELPIGIRPLIARDLRTKSETLRPMVDSVASAISELDYARVSGRGTQSAGAGLADATAALQSAAKALRDDGANRTRTGRFADACAALLITIDGVQGTPGAKGPDWVVRLRQQVEAVVNASGEFQSTADSQLYQNNQAAREAADQVVSQSRLALVERAISDPEVGLIASLPPRTPVITLDADPSLPTIAIAAATTEPTADGTESDLNGAIAAIRQKFTGRTVQAVVLFSDGRQVGGNDGAPPAIDVPLFTVGVAGVLRKDISIVHFDVPGVVFVGETALAHVQLLSTGMKDQSVDVALDVQGKTQKERVVLSEGTTLLSFPIKADVAGTLRVAASISGLPSDANVGTQQSERRIKVLADKLAVAVIGGSAGWDFQYLRNALLRTPWIQCHDEIVRRDVGPLRMSPQEILNQQVVVIDDVDPAAISKDQWNAINQLVTERGGGVIIIAGDDVPPARLATEPSLADLLPWPAGKSPVWQNWAGESAGYRLQTPAEQSSEFLRFSSDPEEDRRRWAELPAFFHILPLNGVKPNVKTLLVDTKSNEPVLTEARVGVGRSLFFGANETWRWRYRVGERDQDRFWLQLMREAGESPYAIEDGAMALDLDNISPQPDQPVQVRARILDDQGRPAKGISPSIRVEQRGAEVMTIPLRPATPQVESGRYVVTLPTLGKGDYDVRLMIGQQSTKLVASVHVEPNFEAEMADISGDDAHLRRLAEASGGEFLRLDQIRDLPEKLTAASQRRPQSIPYPLWDSPYLFLFVLGCLGGEWAMRKRFGLA